MNVLYNLTNEKHFVKTINQWEFDYSLFTDLVRIAKFTNFSLSSFKLRFKLQILYSLQTTEMYLEPSWIFFMEFLCKNDKLFTVFVCVCVCVYALPPVGFFRLHDICDICEKFGSTIFCCEHFLGASAKFLHLYLWIYLISPPKTKTPANCLLERKRYDIMFGIRRKDDIYWYRK